jgi:hypothetical protein
LNLEQWSSLLKEAPDGIQFHPLLESAQSEELKSLHSIIEQIIIRPELEKISSHSQRQKIEQTQTTLREILRQKELDKKQVLFF